ncbi:hypothetical protein MOO44_00045 (plasmid) [Nicoliella spurrieriana]|uniref:Uncharacterized protein n=1 Tax=Nicoliella spurrieriana TaxID=2925830 RepID=A0A976X4R8_9LACO|nr:hypothetical protein [Nicoliella spurrieriana]UQS86070.1 hypothetical protein MOO44_00045 [Nicoliella spurrieriana]
MKIDFDLNKIRALLNDSKEIHSLVRITDDILDTFDPEMPHFKVDVDGCSIYVGSDDDDESVFTFKDFHYLNSIHFEKLANNLEKQIFAKDTLSNEFGIEVGEMNSATKYMDQFSEEDIIKGILQMLDGFDWVHHYVMVNEKLL